jgi:carboxyl-terminal processing protease
MSYYFVVFLLCLANLSAKLPDIGPQDVKEKVGEIMKMHASFKKVDPVVVKRSLNNFLDELDPTKTYFIESDIKTWIDPSDELVKKIENDFDRGNFSEYEKIHAEMVKAIDRRHQLERQIDLGNLPKNVHAKEFKDMKWAKTPDELLTRLKRMRSLQIESASKLNEEIKDKSIQRIMKRQTKFEEEI